MNDLATSAVICAKSVPSRRAAKVRSPRDNEARAKYVYVITPGGDRCKVGVSKSVRSRLSGLQVSTPEKLELYFHVKPESKSALEIEAETLRLLSPWRARGEWFNCQPALAQGVIEAIVGDDVRVSGLIDLLLASDRAWAHFESLKGDNDTGRESAERRTALDSYFVVRNSLWAGWPHIMRKIDMFSAFAYNEDGTQKPRAEGRRRRRRS